MVETKTNRDFTIIKESEPPKNIAEIMLDKEVVLLSYKTAKGFVLFTSKRIVLSTTQKKMQLYTIPYSSITMYSTQNAKGLRDQGLLQIWTNPGLFKFNLKKSINIQELHNLIATQLL